MAVAKGECGEPAGVEDAGTHGAVEGLQAIEVKEAIVRLEEARTGQGKESRQGQQHDPPWRGCGKQFFSPKTNVPVHVAIIARGSVPGKWTGFVLLWSLVGVRHLYPDPDGGFF
jgi:hypothetical protein